MTTRQESGADLIARILAKPTVTVGDVCPVCGENELVGKQSVCSGRCRQRLYKQNRGRPDTKLMLSSEGAKALGKCVSKFTMDSRPDYLSPEKWKDIRKGKAKSLTIIELHKLWLAIPDVLDVLGITSEGWDEGT